MNLYTVAMIFEIVLDFQNLREVNFKIFQNGEKCYYKKCWSTDSMWVTLRKSLGNVHSVDNSVASTLNYLLTSEGDTWN